MSTCARDLNRKPGPAVVLAAFLVAASLPAMASATSYLPPVPVSLEPVRPLVTGPTDETETVLLSGPDSATPRQWSIVMETGPSAGREAAIPVPANWEPAGFGTFAYGHDEHTSADRGRYRMLFEAPERWRGRIVEMVFEGVMTDATVFVNGTQIGPTHQGGYTEFRYDVTESLQLGAENTLEVEVAERSSAPSVNRAEREADYWVFGGIYRPVSLEIHPRERIAHFAVDARADGSLVVEAELEGLDDSSHWWLDATLAEGGALAATVPVSPRRAGSDLRRAKVAARASGVAPWSAEAPNLALLELVLRHDDRVAHRRRERIGFRTVELNLPGYAGIDFVPGLRINGRPAFLRGVNRHDAWPDSGRSLARLRSRADAELLVALGFNAVRTAHSPPSRTFLEVCDELGIYVIDELPGWHDAYATEIGRPLVAEMVRRDVNHPSVILWANGNEGGWNRRLTPLFGLLDPQRRKVLLPDEVYGDIDTRHYPTWDELDSRLEPRGISGLLRRIKGPHPLVLPTEMLHGLWDGGGGAGLAGYLERLRRSPLGLGFFLWAFADDAVARVDRDGALDAAGNLAPDGIVGPHRQWEASAFAVRDLLAPVAALGFDREDGSVRLVNRHDLTDLSALIAGWRWISLPQARHGVREPRVLATGLGRPGAGAPGAAGRLEVGPVPADADLLAVTFARPFDGREIASAALAVAPALPRRRQPATDAAITREGGRVVIRAGGTRAELDEETGELVGLHAAAGSIELRGGMRRADGRPAARGVVRGVVENGVAVVEVDIAAGGPLRIARWSLDGSGSLSFSWLGEDGRESGYDGIRFELPAAPAALEWVGGGPCPVWGNRTAGARLGLWRQPLAGLGGGCDRPLGFFDQVRWMRLSLPSGILIVEPEPGLAIGVGAPSFPEGSKHARTTLPPPASPPASVLTILHRLPSIGTKFHPAAELEPAGEEGGGAFRGSVRLSLLPPEG